MLTPLASAGWMKAATDWSAAHSTLLWWLFAVSVAVSLLTPLMVAWIVVKLPVDYFVPNRHRRMESMQQHPALRLATLLAKNLLGVMLLLAGLVMLVAPGQGLLTIVVGLILLDFPGKYRLERWLITRTQVWRSVNWLRIRAGRPALESPGSALASPKK